MKDKRPLQDSRQGKDERIMSLRRMETSDPPKANRNTHTGKTNFDLKETTKCLQNLVSEAASRIPMYEALYGKTPTIKTLSDFRQLPITDMNTYAELGDVSKAVRNPSQMLGPIAPWNMKQDSFPLSVLHNGNDEKKVTERLDWIMEYMGLQRNERILFLVSPPHQYGVAELVDLLIYLGFQCQIIQVVRQSCQDLHMLLNENGTATVFLATGQDFLAMKWPECVRTLVTFNQPKELKGEFTHFDILHLDEIPLVALREQANPYTWRQDHFYLEQSDKQTLIVTTLSHDLGPFIRYDTGIKAVVDSDNLFLLGN